MIRTSIRDLDVSCGIDGPHVIYMSIFDGLALSFCGWTKKGPVRVTV